MSKYLHKCPEWDYLEIDEHSDCLIACCCYDDEDFLDYKEHHMRELDRYNESLE